MDWKKSDLCVAIQYVDYNSSCLLMPPARSVYFTRSAIPITSPSFNCRIKNIPSPPFTYPLRLPSGVERERRNFCPTSFSALF